MPQSRYVIDLSGIPYLWQALNVKLVLLAGASTSIKRTLGSRLRFPSFWLAFCTPCKLSICSLPSVRCKTKRFDDDRISSQWCSSALKSAHRTMQHVCPAFPPSCSFVINLRTETSYGPIKFTLLGDSEGSLLQRDSSLTAGLKSPSNNTDADVPWQTMPSHYYISVSISTKQAK